MDVRHVIFLSGLSILIVGCSTTPNKKTVVDPATQLPYILLDHRLPMPIAHILPHQLQDTWNAARSGGRVHEGIDIMAPRGTKVHSTTHGIVADLRSNNLGGTVIWIKGPSNSWHYYAHLESHKAGLAVGDYVAKGAHIGYVGNTGNAQHSSPHLHYGIYLQGKGRGAVNPYPYLR